MAVMMAIPLEHRAFGIALCSISIHAFGDVPSPVITGYLKDSLAPNCIGDDDAVSTSAECRDDEYGLRLTMLIVGLWLWWTGYYLKFSCTYCYIFCKQWYVFFSTFLPTRYCFELSEGSFFFPETILCNRCRR